MLKTKFKPIRSNAMSTPGPTPDFNLLAKFLTPASKKYSVDDVIDLMGRIYAAIESVEDYRLKLKWCLGHIIVHLESPPKRRNATMQMLAHPHPEGLCIPSAGRYLRIPPRPIPSSARSS